MGGGASIKSGPGPIAFWSNHPGQSTAVEKELIDRFQGDFPALSVKLIDAGKDYDEVVQKFNAALIGTDVPDVVVLDDIWWFHFALSGAIAPLDELFAQAGVDAGDYVDSLLADYEFDGRHWSTLRRSRLQPRLARGMRSTSRRPQPLLRSRAAILCSAPVR